ncbi:hypothetical protein F5883DRAFT_509218 [Diaporthe sp. PMI_573]|nr:hypothetical protein F5883DRAFT_509218 [Diaporthaceae sp. PMI_573]
MLVRPSLTASTRIHSSATDVIKFLHPGYDAPNNILFALERVDPAPADSPTTFGVHHATALVGCQIIANNAWMGRLALDRKGEQPAGPHTSLDHVLTAKAYYFVIDGQPMYPVVPSFRDWAFPHDEIPEYWPSIPDPEHASERCVLTDSSYSKTDGHLVPKEAGGWFTNNSMGVYGVDRRDTEDSANLIPLRVDVHTWLDNRGWTITPKPSLGQGNQYVAHVLDTKLAPEFYNSYHNIQLRLPGRSVREYVFAHFAWTLIQLVKPFVTSSISRAVVHVQKEQGKAPQWLVEELQGDQLNDLYGGGGLRSASPKKRKQSSTREEHNPQNRTDMIYERIKAEQVLIDWDRSEINRLYQQIRAEAAIKKRGSSDIEEDIYDDWECRGRPRKRRNWHAHEDDASTVSDCTEASPCNKSFSTEQSDLDWHPDMEHRIPTAEGNGHHTMPIED